MSDSIEILAQLNFFSIVKIIEKIIYEIKFEVHQCRLRVKLL